MTTTAIDRGLGAELAEDLAATAFTLAKRFSAGATMWSIAPSWEPHALHIAVEFVHPVIMGKRALPAVALTGPDLVDLVRVSVQPGDIVVAVSGADNAQVRSVMRRSPAWGATTIWIGSGERPRAGMADHVLWLDDPDPRVPATGGFVLFYHLLWELTHVCFEHSGLLKPEPAEEVCVTCSDEGRLGEVVTAAADGQPRWPRCAPRAVSRTWSRRLSTRSPPASWCWCTPARRSATWTTKMPDGRGSRRTPMTRRADQLPVPVHRRRGRRSQIAARRPGRVGAGKSIRKPGTAALHAGSQRRPAGGGSHRDGPPLRGRRTDVHLRKRRQLHRFHHFGGIVRPAAGRQAAAGLVVDRRSSDPDRTGQRRRVRAGVRPPVDRPREGR